MEGDAYAGIKIPWELVSETHGQLLVAVWQVQLYTSVTGGLGQAPCRKSIDSDWTQQESVLMCRHDSLASS